MKEVEELVNFRQLQTFLEIVQLGSFSAAANKLNATQSTISARIQELESDLGVVLFDRSQRKATITAKGRELVGYAERAMRLQTEILQQIPPRESLSGIVRVGVSELVAMTWLPKLAATLRERYPNIGLEFDIALTMALNTRLASGELDIALIPGHSFEPSLSVRPLGAVQFCWMSSSAFEMPNRPLVPTDLKSVRVLSLGQSSIHYNTVSAWLADSGTTQRPDLCNSMTVLSTLTAAGVGISLLPPCCYEKELAQGVLKILPANPSPPKVPFAAVYKKRQIATLQEIISDAAAEVSSFV